MSNNLDNEEYGITATKFEVMPPNVIRNKLLAFQRQYLGSDLGQSSGDPVVKIDESLASEINLVYQEMLEVLNQVSGATAIGLMLDRIAESRGITRKVSIPAQTIVKFERTESPTATTTIPTYVGGTLPGAAATIESAENSDIVFYVSEAADVVMPIEFAFARGYGDDYDHLSGQDGYEKYREAQSVEWVSDTVGPSPANRYGWSKVVEMVMGSVGGIDTLPTDYQGYSSSVWVSDNIDGSGPYTITTDYLLPGTLDGIDWSPAGSEPTVGDTYYVHLRFDGTGAVGISGKHYYEYTADDDFIKWDSHTAHAIPVAGTVFYTKFVGVKVDVDTTCVTTGTVGNVQNGTLTNLTTGPTSTISSVVNESDVKSGADTETDAQLSDRIQKSGFIRGNKNSLEASVLNVEGIRGVKVKENAGKFICVVDPVYVANDGLPNLALYRRTLNNVKDARVLGIIPTAIVKITKGAADGRDYIPFPYIRIPKIGVVSDNRDGSGTYTKATDYVAYVPNTDYIDWNTGGGTEPTPGDDYFIELYEAIEIAESVEINITASLLLNSASDVIGDVELDIEKSLQAFFDTLSSGKHVFFFDITERITAHPSLRRIEDIEIQAIVRMRKSTNPNDYNVNGMPARYLQPYSGASGDWVSDSIDGSSPYTHSTDYTFNTADPNLPYVTWVTAPPPAVGDYYYVSCRFKGDLLFGDAWFNIDIVPRLGTVILSLGTDYPA